MTTASPKTLNVAEAAFQDFSQGLSTGDWSRFLAWLSDDFTFWFPAGPFKGLNSGKEKATDFFAMVSKVFPEGLTLTLERTFSSGNTVLFEVRSQGLMLGHPYENQAAISFDIAGDKVCGYREYLGVIFQIGG
ncbi:nuclear transport factor 2 family protein [Leptolyngbyaceae cyanobacterium CCMR0082]|uniref:Nuclear transport factor 2 family protein n=2 Tax=Adonisia turfae TaxID=2950184 RepID=A0A6M0SF61_9CYAN|nr:nuclear transport factor 2 family protein [Adonisia turfae]MDV3347251.1 nuclear transport factor 2 family protein [Leptothoe sp. LEGE 181152]NEZ56201.1 nuclear transport factor 2 family protein [Adonisia turfae CCMR0081]NEZ66673.1 nuclear transport factor 2 family protein [Adonisia turfae CCMR0082]